MSRSRSRASDLEAPWRGVRAARMTRRAVRDLCRAYLPRLRSGQFFSHTTAAVILGIPLPLQVESDQRLHVSAPSGRQPPRARSVIGHRLSGEYEIRFHQGLPVCAPEAVWIQLAAILSVDDLVVAGDYLVKRKRPLSTLPRLTAAVESAGSRRAVQAAREALELVRAGTDSPMETRLRLLIVRSGLPEPVIGHRVYNRFGEFIGTPDLAYVHERIAMEYQGQVHQSDPNVYAEDVIRREQFEDDGWRVIAVYKHHMRSREAWVVTRIEKALHTRA